MSSKRKKEHKSIAGQFRRYLVEIDTASTHQLFTDCLVIGAGIAGLRAAIEASENCNVIVVCKGTLDQSNTWHAQGGIASVLDEKDTFEEHIADTLKTGCGLCDGDVVDMVVKRGPELVRELLRWGTDFDMEGTQIAMTLEAGHSHKRVAHAHGDETGRIIAEALIKKVKQNPKIKIIENFYTIDLITEDKKCLGLIGQDVRGRQIIWAANTILATGGAGMLYRETTNPDVATADGLAMAWRAGAKLQDLEFFQFHPTTLYVAGASRALVTEALRGEGAILVDSKGKAFMKEYDERAELAPRDVVSRACLSQMLKTKSTHVYLDVRHFKVGQFPKRFPRIFELCNSFGIDVSSELIPVRPSAHYMVGGLWTDIQGRTSIENLYSCGEAAATGLHGANRLASNSLLEGLVFGQITGRNASETGKKGLAFKPVPIQYEIPQSERTRLDTGDIRNSLRALMWRNVGITRKAKHMTEAMEITRFWQRYVMDKEFHDQQGWECQNMLTVSLLITYCALNRKESRGVHYRVDFPSRNDDKYNKHISICSEDFSIG